MKYTVVVGNIGTVLETNNEEEAFETYREYVEMSKDNYGRAAGEDVVVFFKDDILVEYFGDISDEDIA